MAQETCVNIRAGIKLNSNYGTNAERVFLVWNIMEALPRCMGSFLLDALRQPTPVKN
jgi:hypothetical protein